ncbi:MAG TPA: TIGR02996 domain-containing protein, partial [Kofleriaceae bacterium]
MDRVVAARKLVAELVKSKQLEVRRVEIVAKDLAALMDELNRPPSGRELEEWLDAHAQVNELYASENVLEELAYRHLAPPPSNVEAAEARHAELEQRIREAPDAVEGYQIYADWLQEQGDPFGELIALGIAGITDERLERFRVAHQARFFGGMSKDLLRRVHLHWKHGVVHTIEESVEYGMLGPFEWSRLLQLRVCGFVQSIKLLQACTDELDGVLAEHAPTTLNALEVYAGSGSVPARLFERPL